MTSVGDLSLPSCDGVIAPEFCSGLAVVSRFPILEVPLNPQNLCSSINLYFFRWTSPHLLCPETCSGITSISSEEALAESGWNPLEGKRLDPCQAVSEKKLLVDCENILFQVDIYVTSLASMDYNYWYREHQAVQLVPLLAK